MALEEAVYLCGHNSTHTAGADSCLLRRPDGTATMVDTPRWSTSLAARHEALALGTADACPARTWPSGCGG